ncbi:MAG: hypothetical protein HY390_04300 [Deltaproteobacteria bacterium]|nr:hypothetical protein [Deltaproteobacteria bacterium]
MLTEVVSDKDRWRQKYQKYYLGKVIHYYSKLQVGIIAIEQRELKVGDVIYIRGISTFFKQSVGSIEYQHRKVKRVGPGYEVGIRVGARVREGDYVYVMPQEV